MGETFLARDPSVAQSRPFPQVVQNVAKGPSSLVVLPAMELVLAHGTLVFINVARGDRRMKKSDELSRVVSNLHSCFLGRQFVNNGLFQYE
jgi:hypothetical protein